MNPSSPYWRSSIDGHSDTTSTNIDSFAQKRGSQHNPQHDLEAKEQILSVFEREIQIQSGGAVVPPLPPKKSSRGNSIGDLLASGVKTVVEVVVDGFEEGPTPPSSQKGVLLAQSVSSRESPDAAAGAPSFSLLRRSLDLPTIRSEVELSALSPSSSSIRQLLQVPSGLAHPSERPVSSSAKAYSTNKLVVLGRDISHLPKHQQYISCACGVFFFTLIYGYFQELVVVKIFDRQLPLFLALCQFTGYTVYSVLVSMFINKTGSVSQLGQTIQTVPYRSFVLMAALRAFDLGMTNSSMRYVNYPVKTLMKSSRVIFTMLFGSLIMRKRHRKSDYVVVFMMVSGLAFFIHAETTAKNGQHDFSFVGIGMLILSLLADGAVVNLNEKLMNVHSLGQDELIFLLYSLAASLMFVATTITGELWKGLGFILSDDAVREGSHSYTSREKVLSTFVFVLMGFLGSSCAGAITKHFGALSMSITSTARKATTLFLSFVLFPKVCTFQHILGMTVFVMALVVKSFISFKKKPTATTLLPFHNADKRNRSK